MDAPLHCVRVLYVLFSVSWSPISSSDCRWCRGSLTGLLAASRHFYKSVIDTYLKTGAQFTFLLYEIGSAVIKCTYKTKHSYITWNQNSCGKLQQCQNVRTFSIRAPSAELEQFPVCSGRTLGSLQRRRCKFNTEYAYTQYCTVFILNSDPFAKSNRHHQHHHVVPVLWWPSWLRCSWPGLILPSSRSWRVWRGRSTAWCTPPAAPSDGLQVHWLASISTRVWTNELLIKQFWFADRRMLE